jgi:hypothetical protein
MSDRPSITFLNMTGDVTIVWDPENREKILALVKQKLKEGYSFFTTKKVPLIEVYRKVKVTNKNINSIDSIVIPDEEFEKLTKSFNDEDIAANVNGGTARLAKRQGQASLDAVQRLKDPEDVVKNQSLAVRPIAGG